MKNENFEVNLELRIGLVWVDRYFILEKDEYKLIKTKKNKIFTSYNEKSYSLKNAVIKRYKDDEMVIKIKHNDGSKNLLRFSNTADRNSLIENVKNVVKEISKRNAFSKKYKQNENEINSSRIVNGTNYDDMTHNLKRLGNLIQELEQKINELESFINEGKIKKVEDKDHAITISNSMGVIKDEMKTQFTTIMEQMNVINKKSITEPKEAKVISDNEFYSCDSEEEQKHDVIEQHTEETPKNREDNVKSFHRKFTCSLKFSKENAHSDIPKYEPRTLLKKKFKFEQNVFSDITSVFKNSKLTLPINYHEPISFLQRQCEIFLYNSILTKASKIQSKPLQMCYVAAFLVASLSLNIKRLLKPFEPILGETFEYYDPNKEYRFFAEKVNQEPKISAFIGESDSWIFYGDSRCKPNYKILKGSLTMEFFSKYHLLFKESNNYYTISKPKMICKGLVLGEMRIEIEDTITIEDVNDKKLKLVLSFSNEKKEKQPGAIEGKVLENEKEVYLIKGNWNGYVNYCTPDGKNINNIWKIIEDKYLNNNQNEYYLPNMSYNLNYLTEDMMKVLPPTDSRFRPDIREYEEGSNDKAAEIKTKMDKYNKEKFNKMEKENILYQPNYFNEVYDQNSGEYVYIYKGGYWEDREKRNYSHLDADIFKYKDE